jgi:folylpolyglutamate synthase
MKGIESCDVPINLEDTLPKVFSTGLTTTVWRGRAENVQRDYGTWYLDGAHTVESLEIVCDWFGKRVREVTLHNQAQPACILVFNQQTGTRDAKQLIDSVQKRLSKTWGIEPSVAVFCANVTYRDQGYKLGG